MSEGTHNIGDEQPVVGEPASHPHQAVVVGEPPEDVAPVLGEPAFANGLQDQQLTLPPSAEETSANGVQSSSHIPFHEEGLASVLASSHVSAPSSAASVEESPDLQRVLSAEAGIGEAVTHQIESPAEAGTGEAGTHQLEPPVAEFLSPSALHVDQVATASDDPVVGVTANTHNEALSAEEEPAADIPEVEEVAHIVDGPSEVSLAPTEVSTENPSTHREILDGDTHFTDGAPAANSPSAPEISLKGLSDQQEAAPPSSAVQEKQSVENSASMQTDTVDGPLEGSKADNEDVHTAEREQSGQGNALDQESGTKEANLDEEEIGSSVVEQTLNPEPDEASKRDVLVQGKDTSEDIPAESEATSREAGLVLNTEVPLSEASCIEASTPKMLILDESHAIPIASELQITEEMRNEVSLMDQDTRDIPAEDCSVNQPPAVEASFTATANGDNGYQHDEDGEFDREQDLPKDDDDASAEVEKPSSRSKLPLIFTGLAIAAVGVAVASISRPH